MYTDQKKVNVWRHYDTQELPIEPLILSFAEPNVGMVDNFAQVWVNAYADDETKFNGIFNDGTCNDKIPVLCEDVGNIVIKFWGMCKFSLIDTTYTMVEGDMNKKRFFARNTGWDEDNQLWKLRSPKKEYMYGMHTEFVTYPLGKNYWQIVNDTRCVYPNPEKVQINMSPCNASSFTCDDGTCIPMTGR